MAWVAETTSVSLVLFKLGFKMYFQIQVDSRETSPFTSLTGLEYQDVSRTNRHVLAISTVENGKTKSFWLAKETSCIDEVLFFPVVSLSGMHQDPLALMLEKWCGKMCQKTLQAVVWVMHLGGCLHSTIEHRPLMIRSPKIHFKNQLIQGLSL